MFESHARPGATPENVERALEFSKEVSDLIDLHHPNSVPVSRSQTTIAVALFMQALEHRQAILLLVNHGVRSSAAALIRPMFESYFRGIWALKVATDEQTKKIFGKHPHIPSLDTVLQQLKKNAATAALASSDSWKKAGDYVHSGPLQLSRWLGLEGIEPQHSDSETIEMLEASDLCGLMAIIETNDVCGQQPQELGTKLTELTMRQISRRAVEVYYGSTGSSPSESNS